MITKNCRLTFVKKKLKRFTWLERCHGSLWSDDEICRRSLYRFSRRHGGRKSSGGDAFNDWPVARKGRSLSPHSGQPANKWTLSPHHVLPSGYISLLRSIYVTSGPASAWFKRGFIFVLISAQHWKSSKRNKFPIIKYQLVQQRRV